MKLGAARSKAPSAWRLLDITLDENTGALTFSLNRNKLRAARRREGRYLLRTNLTESDPAQLWQYYIQLVAVEEAFKTLKGDLAIRPIFHQCERRIEAHIFVAFLAYCLQVTLHRRLNGLAPGLTARSALAKFAAVQMIDVHLPTTDGREIMLTRNTEPEPELRLLIQQLKLDLPPQPPPRIATSKVPKQPPVVKTFPAKPLIGNGRWRQNARIREDGLGCSDAILICYPMADCLFRATCAIHLSAANDSNGWSIRRPRRFVNERLHGAHQGRSDKRRRFSRDGRSWRQRQIAGMGGIQSIRLQVRKCRERTFGSRPSWAGS